MKLTYKIGDVRSPEETAPFIIPHCVNDCHPSGVMGSGVALALLKKWEVVKDAYHAWAEKGAELPEEVGTTGPFRLGEVQFLKVEDDVFVANMVGQRECGDWHGIPPVRYEAVRDCLIKLKLFLNKKKKIKTICAPKFCSELAGGNWTIVEGMIRDIFEDTDYNWVIYSLPPSPKGNLREIYKI